MNDFNVHQKKDSGRTTLYMSEKLPDLTNIMIFLIVMVSKEHKITVLGEVKRFLESAIEKTIIFLNLKSYKR